jgi:hypothetical protein
MSHEYSNPCCFGCATGRGCEKIGEEVSKHSKELQAALDAALIKLRDMTPEEQAAMWVQQRESWLRGEMTIGNDEAERKYREEYREETPE